MMNRAVTVEAQPCAWEPERVEQHTPLVKRIAYHLMNRLPSSVQVDDLIQAGMLGLLEALRHYDASQGASFETYAGIRIRGAMLDELRRHDWAPRSVHRKARQVAEVVRQIEHEQGRDARDHEIAERLGLSLGEYHELLQSAVGQRVFSVEELGVGEESLLETVRDESPGVVERLQEAALQARMAEALASLPERERLVMSLYYDEELNLREIGAVLGVSESRVCQIHGQAVIRLQARLTPEFAPDLR